MSDGNATKSPTDNLANKPSKNPTKEEILKAIKELAGELGHAPHLRQLREKTGITEKKISKLFGNYSNALLECGLERFGNGLKVEMEKLFMEWAAMVRELGKLPTLAEYALRSRYSTRPLITRFEGWKHVPGGMLQYAEESGRTAEWQDVMDVIKKASLEVQTGACTSTTTNGQPLKPRILPDRPVYGDLAITSALVCAPTSEMGVVSLFSALAVKLGFAIIHIGTLFPHSECFRRVGPGQWQRVRIEFEFVSRNFLSHGHDPAKCDMVVCWEHNWEECPLEVLELSKAVKGMIESA